MTTRDTQRLRLIRQHFSPAPAPCAVCGGSTKALTHAEAAAFARTDLARIEALVEAGRLHQTHGGEGGSPPLICLDSLLGDGHVSVPVAGAGAP